MRDFRGKTAWFSSSVSKECKQVWLKGGGKLVGDINYADYIFGDDPSTQDMSRFYKSRLFLDKGVEPFMSIWLLDTNRSILDCILYPEDFKETVSVNEQAFKDVTTSPTFHIFEELRNSQSQDSESTFCQDDYEIQDLPNHEKSKTSPNRVSDASSLECVRGSEDSSLTTPRMKESRNSFSKGSENATHLENGDDDDNDSDDDGGDDNSDDDKNDDDDDEQLKSKIPNISPTLVKASCLPEWNIDTFEDEGPCPAFHRIKDFRKIYSLDNNSIVPLDDDKVIAPESMNSKTLDNTSNKEKRKGGSDLLEEPTKAPMPSHDGNTLEKVETGHCKGIVSSVISSHIDTKKSVISCHEDTRKPASSAISSHRDIKKPAIYSHENTKRSASSAKSSDKGTRKQAQVTRPQDKNSKTRRKEDRHYTVQDENLIDDADSIPLKSFTGQDAPRVVPSSVTLRELEIPTHVFHSSMHDGFTRLEDIELPEGLKLRDFFTKDDEKAASEYQVYLRYPPTKVPKS